MSNLIEMTNISKAYGSNKVLEDVSIQLEAGSVHALMGENGAGKSTLMKILAGVVTPDTGSIRKSGNIIQCRSPKQALDYGISTVFQELSLLSNLSISENMFLGKEPISALGFIRKSTMDVHTKAALAALDLDLNPRTLVSELSIAERQFVEIAHGINAKADVVILDEPTAALNAADVELLNRHIRNLRDQGKAIVYISHRMEEIFNICDVVTVLKDGKMVDTQAVADVTPQSLIAMMVGRDIKDLYPARSNVGTDPALTVDNFMFDDSSNPLSFSINKGEIVALAGLEGQGQREILRALVGDFQPLGGSLTVNGTTHSLPISAPKGIGLMQKQGVGFVPEDRKYEGLLLSLPIGHNIAIGLYALQSSLSVSKNYNSVVSEIMDAMAIKASSAKSRVSDLSGGNQQKVLLGRSLASELNVLLIEEPTRGVDIGAKAEIYRLLREFTNQGGAVLVLSRETVELIGLCDRLLVVHNKKIVGEMQAQHATEHLILDAALSA
ncbi:MAG: sugar ABC transporter ATP-binding protein [Granulosicoccus sp.]